MIVSEIMKLTQLLTRYDYTRTFQISIMKDKLVRTPFNETAFHNKVHEHYLGYQGELQKITDKKSEIFIQVNYFGSVLDDVMEFFLKTDQARGMKPHQIIDILFQKGILVDDQARNANKVLKIRNLFAHNYDSPHMMRNVAEMINKMKFELTDFPILPGHTEDSIKELMEKTISKWDVHQKLDFFIHDVVMDIENKAIFMKD